MANLLELDSIREAIDSANHSLLISYIEDAFKSYSEKRAVIPPVGTLTFDKPPADVHIKYGYIKDEDHFVIKIASGFYDNPQLGLSSSNGLNLVFSQRTGILETILLDKGYLTDLRTALAGAVVAKHLAPLALTRIGIVGTGIQARLQLRHLKETITCRQVLVWGRSRDKLEVYKTEMETEGFQIEITEESNRIPRECQLIVTTTPSKSPILANEKLQAGTLITAIGADTEGKQELDFSLLAQANLIVMDSTTQCQSHGEIHKAFHQNLLRDHTMLELGTILNDPSFTRVPSDIIIVDLTGIATQDIQISKFVLEQINRSHS